MNPDEKVIRFISCPSCGKSLKVECPDPAKDPKKIQAVLPKDDSHLSLAQRKSRTMCTGCAKVLVIQWYY